MMWDPGDAPFTATGDVVSGHHAPVSCADHRVPLLKLSTVRTRMDSIQRFLSESVNRNALLGRDQMKMVSSEINSAIQEIIVNGAALLSCTSQAPISEKTTEPLDLKPPPKVVEKQLTFVASAKSEAVDEDAMEGMDGGDIVEIDAVELLAEHIHFCEICGKGFKRDANLRMHMRAHGNQFKTPEALAKPLQPATSTAAGINSGFAGTKHTRFSCPFQGCNRNRLHKRFRPLRSVICMKNHFKRSHCPKMYLCNRCHKKNFSVLADLKSHLRHCGESKWRCSCGTSFSRKDKLFGHMALFEGHMPAVLPESDEEIRTMDVVEDDDDEKVEDTTLIKPESAFAAAAPSNINAGIFEELLEEFGAIDSFNLQDMLGSPNGF